MDPSELRGCSLQAFLIMTSASTLYAPSTDVSRRTFITSLFDASLLEAVFQVFESYRDPRE